MTTSASQITDAEANTVAAISWLRSVGLDVFSPAELDAGATRAGPAMHDFATTILTVADVASQARNLGLRADAANTLQECATKLMGALEAIRTGKIVAIQIEPTEPAAVLVEGVA